MTTSLRTEYLDTARRKLDTLTKLILIRTVERSQAEKLNLIADTNGTLLQISVAEDAVSRIDGATRRSGLLLDWSVGQATSEQADKYLSEASSCFIYGFFAACGVMCRSLLEEALERRLPNSLFSEGRLANSRTRTLGDLLRVLNDNLTQTDIDPEAPRALRKANDLGSLAAHDRPLTESEALQCLKETRRAIQLLLR